MNSGANPSCVYLDHHSATRPISSAIEKMLPFYREQWGVMTAPHFKGQELVCIYKKIQDQILECLGDKESSVFHFCASGAEAINSAFFSHYFEKVRQSGQNHILSTQLESAPILLSLQRLEEWGCATKLLSVNAQGQITKEMLLKALRPRTGLLSISWAQGLTGVMHPIADLAEVCQEKNIALHVDASHILGKLYFRLEDLPIDFLTFDGKLLHAPQGSGGIISKKNIPYTPLVVGDNAVPMALAAALAQALMENARTCDHICLEIARLRDKLEQGIKCVVSDAIVFFEQVERLPNCTAMGFPGISGEALLYLLHRQGIYATIGGGSCQRLSHVLIASGIDSVLAESAVSFSLSFETTEAQIDYAIATIGACVDTLKKCSMHIWEKT